MSGTMSRRFLCCTWALCGLLATVLSAPTDVTATPVSMSISGFDSGGNTVSALITIDLDDFVGDTDIDLKVTIENTSTDNSTITNWGLETPSEDPLATPTVAVSGTDDDGEWFFVSPINGTGSTTNGVGTFGEFDFGMSTSSSATIC